MARPKGPGKSVEENEWVPSERTWWLKGKVPIVTAALLAIPGT